MAKQETKTNESAPERSPVADGARKRAAVEMIAKHGAALRRTARRYSFDAEDAEDAYQRALEIALTKAPTTDPRELIRWTQTVTKHEALAVRQSRERLLGYQPSRHGEEHDPVAAIPARSDGPDAQAERREEVARSREALRALKPAELRALGLLAEGYSYSEIGESTGYSYTNINRLLAEGRARFRSFLARSEDGGRCRDLQPLLSAFCDGEASPGEAATVREHLKACAHCRATMRAYRSAPRIAAALLPLVPPSRSLLGRAQELAGSLWSRLPGGGESVTTQVAAAGGSRGAGMAAIAKLLTVCAGAAGGAACVATGVVPTPLLTTHHDPRPAAARPVAADAAASSAVEYEPAPPPSPVVVAPDHKEKPDRKKEKSDRKPVSEPAEPTAEAEAAAGAVAYEPPPPPVESAPAPANESSTTPSGSAAGEFGP